MFTLDARLTALSSSALLAALDRVAADGRELTADLIALLAECDGRKLYAAEGYESLFEFCVRRLRLSESQAYHRIQAARAARDFPLVLERLRAGRVTMTAVALLREHLTQKNCREVIDWAEGRRKREVEIFVRARDPRPDVRSSVRRLAVPQARATAADSAVAGEPSETPQPRSNETPAAPVPELEACPLLTFVPPAHATTTPAEEHVPVLTQAGVAAAPRLLMQSAPVRRAEIRPLSPARYSLHVTISNETHDKLRRAQDLLGHTGPADPADVIDRAMTLLVAQLERKKAGAPPRPERKATSRPSVMTAAAPATRAGRTSPSVAKTAEGGATRKLGTRRRRSRYIPAAVRRAVWERDGARCAYVSPRGIRCTATSRLEFHHRVPFADGGPPSVDNIALACTLHNQAEAERWFNFDWTELGQNGSARRGSRWQAEREGEVGRSVDAGSRKT